MPYPSEGTLTTDEREVAVSETWDSDSDWNAAQSMSNVVVQNGVLMLDAIPDSAIMYFEDGDITIDDDNWSGFGGDTGNLTATDQTVIDGGFSGKHTASNSNSTISMTRGAETTLQFGYICRLGSTTTSDDEVFHRFYDGDGSMFGQLEWVADGSSLEWLGDNSTVLSSWSTNTNYEIIMDWDFTNDQVDIYVNGNLENSSAGFSSSVTGLGVWDERNETADGGSTRSVYLDNFREADNLI